MALSCLHVLVAEFKFKIIILCYSLLIEGFGGFLW